MGHRDTKRILISGSSGLIGGHVVPFLEGRGHEIWRLLRRPVLKDREIHWDPQSHMLDSDRLNGFDAVLHFAGENIAAGRWTKRRQGKIRASRIEGTTLLCERLVAARNPPKLLISASGIGYYGHRGNEVVDERSGTGDGFLADVCRGWEAACEPARNAGIRVINLRIGMVLSPKGGVLAKMLPVFRLGLGGVLGSGEQQISWVSIEDLLTIIDFAIEHQDLCGPINAVAPHPVTNREFTKTLGRVIHRPTLLTLPAFAITAICGRMGRELLLEGQRATPARLLAAGYGFAQPTLEPALRALLTPKESGG